MQGIFDIKTDHQFRQKAIEIYHHQFNHNRVYQEFVIRSRGKKINPQTIEEIPFLPVEFFKSHTIISTEKEAEIVFTSSGTTGMSTSKHYVADIELYKQSFVHGFEHFYGNVSNYCFLALLPSYLEREGSSLIYMVEKLIEMSNCADSGFYLYDYEALLLKIKKIENQGKKIILIGVTYALLDLAEMANVNMENVLVMETGGMKGKRKEMTKTELHTLLHKQLNVSTIHSEYGMTELLSQAYSAGGGKFLSPPWMKVLIRDIYDPFSYVTVNKSGGINIIDLANVHSCSFIETKDIGKIAANGEFEVLGRYDSSDIRGCNLLVQ